MPPLPRFCHRVLISLVRPARQPRAPSTPLSSKSSPSSTVSASTASSLDAMLSKPAWSVRSLCEPQLSSPEPAITPDELHHLLRLAALPQPASQQEEQAMLDTLHGQLLFVRAVQRVNTNQVPPFSAIRDETDDGVRERTMGLAELRSVLDQETPVGYYKRLRRVPEKTKSEAENNWSPLATASKTANGRYYVVKGGPKEGGSA